jgi:peptidoglycan hydrolase-like protein with peptidoglycan-binding domain
VIPSRRRATVGAAVLTAVVVASGCSAVGELTGSGSAAGPSTAAPSTTTTSPEPTPTPTTPAATPSPSGPPPSTPSEPSPSPSKSKSADPTQSPTPTQSPGPAPRRSDTLRTGDSGTQVRALQERLTELGYWLGPVDGAFGPLTQQAVFALQKSAGIARDGVVGPDTRRALDRGARPKATLGGDGVEVDLARQVVFVVRGGSVRTILNTSTGNGEKYTTTYGSQAIARTPTGTFTFLRHVDGMTENSLGKLWRPIFFTSTGYAVHGSTSVPPYPASHGCVRVSNAAMNMIWSEDLMPVGSTIRVR